MSALGQKQTYAVQLGMSALPPIATSIASALFMGLPINYVFDPAGERGA
jgi:hypothetical protein